MVGIGTALTFEDTEEIEGGRKYSSAEDHIRQVENEESEMEDDNEYEDGDTQEHKVDRGSEGNKSKFVWKAYK